MKTQGRIIYKLEHLPSGKCYIGLCKSVNKSIKHYKFKEMPTLMGKIARESEWSDFDYEILHENVPDAYVEELKEECIKLYDTLAPNGLNMDLNRKVRQKSTLERLAAAQVGRKPTSETIEKMRKAATGKVPTAEAIEKWRQSHKGYRHTPETIEKIRAGNLGKTRSEETKANMRAGKALAKTRRQAQERNKKEENNQSVVPA